MRVNITWIVKATGNAACIGFDEKDVEVESLAEALENAINYGIEAGIDMDRFEPVVEAV